MKIRKFEKGETNTLDKLSYELIPQDKEEADYILEAEDKIFFRLERGGVSPCGRFLKGELHEATEVDRFMSLTNNLAVFIEERDLTLKGLKESLASIRTIIDGLLPETGPDLPV